MYRFAVILAFWGSAGCDQHVPHPVPSVDVQSQGNTKAPIEDAKKLNSQSKLEQLARTGFAMAGDSVQLGFDVKLIEVTTSMMPNGIDDELKTLFTTSWPSDFFLGAIEFFGSDRINAEHKDLYPGLTVIRQGFICFGSDGSGTIFTYCPSDRRVYLLPNEYFSDDGLRSHAWEKLETTPDNIKSLAEKSWDSLDSLFDWALIELQKLEQE